VVVVCVVLVHAFVVLVDVVCVSCSCLWQVVVVMVQCWLEVGRSSSKHQIINIIAARLICQWLGRLGRFVDGRVNSLMAGLILFVDFCSHDPVLASLGQYGTVLGQYWVSTEKMLTY
jgi:hypothetical protein